MRCCVISFIGTTFLSADTELISEESIVAIAVASSGVVVRVDRASHAVPVADEVVAWANLAKTSHQTKSTKADTGICSRRIG